MGSRVRLRCDRDSDYTKNNHNKESHDDDDYKKKDYLMEDYNRDYHQMEDYDKDYHKIKDYDRDDRKIEDYNRNYNNRNDYRKDHYTKDDNQDYQDFATDIKSELEKDENKKLNNKREKIKSNLNRKEKLWSERESGKKAEEPKYRNYYNQKHYNKPETGEQHMAMRKTHSSKQRYKEPKLRKNGGGKSTSKHLRSKRSVKRRRSTKMNLKRRRKRSTKRGAFSHTWFFQDRLLDEESKGLLTRVGVYADGSLMFNKVRAEMFWSVN